MTTQVNLKFQEDFFDLAKDYADSRGYMSIQEFIREAVRDKIFDNLELRNEYKKVLESKEANTFSSVKDSKEFMNKLRERAKFEKDEGI